MSQEHGVLYYFGTARTWHLLCLMSKTKPGPVMRASCLQVCLEAGSSRNFKSLLHILKGGGSCQHCNTCFGDDEILKPGIKLHIQHRREIFIEIIL